MAGSSSSAMVRTAKFERIAGGREYTESVRFCVAILEESEDGCKCKSTEWMIYKIDSNESEDDVTGLGSAPRAFNDSYSE
jgi:hypothetical protein